MKISLQLLLDHCQIARGFLSLSGENISNDWYQIHHYNSCWLGKSGILLFSAASELPKSLSGQGIVSYGKPSDELLQKNNVLWFEPTVQKKQLYIYLQNIILKFNSLDVEMSEIIRKQGSLQDLTEIAAEMFGNPVIIHDQDFYQLAASQLTETEHAWEYDPSCEQYRLPYEIINDFKINPDYMETMETKGPQIFPNETFDYRILYRNLWYRGEYRGRVLVDETRRSLQKSDRDLLEYFTELVKEYFRSRLYTRNLTNHQLAQALQAMLSGKLTDPTFLSTQLLYNSWTQHDDYLCAVLFPQAGDLLAHAIQYHCNLLSEKLAASCAFEWENHIVLLLNATVGEYTVRGLQNEIAAYLRDGLMKAGISSVGNDLNEFACCYQQAVSAYETGRQKDPTFWSYAFDNYRTEYVLRNALRSFPAEFLCRPEIALLQEYDRAHTSELTHTLRIYLSNERALLKTSEELQIHRTTLLYRIRRVEELTGLQLDDENTRFELLLSFHLLDVKLS